MSTEEYPQTWDVSTGTLVQYKMSLKEDIDSNTR